MAKHDLRVDLFYDQQWHDHTADTYTRDPVTITQGRANESGRPAPASMALTFRSPNGAFNPANPAGALYGKIGRNMPVRVSLAAVPEGFEDATLDITVIDGGDAAWARATDQAHTGTWSFKSGAIVDAQSSEAAVTVPAGANSLTFWYRVSSEVDFDFLDVDVDGQAVVLSVSGIVDWTFAHIDVRGASTVTFSYSKDSSMAVGDDAAWVDDITFADIRFAGEAASWRPRQSLDPGDAWVPITAAGIMRRLRQGASPLLSAPRRYIPTTNPVAYWPFDDGPLSQAVRNAVAGGAAFRLSNLPVTVKTQLGGGGELAPWLGPALSVAQAAGTGDSFTGQVNVASDVWSVDWVFRAELQQGQVVLQVTGSGLQAGVNETTRQIYRLWFFP